MVTIAICDDEADQRAEIAGLLAAYQTARPGAELLETVFSSGEALLEQVRISGGFQLYLLDVIMPGRDGIALGLEIRKLDPGAVIVYLTTSPDFAVDSYLARAFYYLLKPLDLNRFFSVLDEAIQMIVREESAALAVKTRDGLRRLEVKSIQYAELSKRCVGYVLADGTTVQSILLRGSFRDAVAPLLAYRRFVLCSASFAVNLTFAAKIERGGMRLKSGVLLPLSRPFRAEVTNRWMNYNLEGGTNA